MNYSSGHGCSGGAALAEGIEVRLTQQMRDIFVRSVLDDVPSQEFSDKARQLIQAELLKRVPKEIQAIYKQASLRGFIGLTTLYGVPGGFGSSYVGADSARYEDLSEVTRKAVDEMARTRRAQNTSREELRRRLNTAATSCTTRKQLADRFPEFEKYIPGAEEVAARNLPVDTSIVSDLVKAGWPKGKQKQSSKMDAA